MQENHEYAYVILYSLPHNTHTHIHTHTHTHTHTGQIPVTVVLTESNIYLARENFHQWPFPRLQELPPRETLKPPFCDVHCKDITDIEQIVSWHIPSSLSSSSPVTPPSHLPLQILDRDQSSQCVLKFFKEVKIGIVQSINTYWTVLLHNIPIDWEIFTLNNSQFKFSR